MKNKKILAPPRAFISSLKRKYPHVLGATAIAAFLAIPFTLRELSWALEIYPAILLPSGPSIAKRDGDIIQLQQIEIWGESRTGEWLRIENVDFIRPAPRSNFFSISRDGFGLENPPVLDADFRGIQLFKFYYMSSEAFEAERPRTMEWLSKRLHSLGLKDDSFALIKRRTSFDIKQRETLSSEIINEKVFAIR